MRFEDNFGKLLEIFGEILEDFWILFDTLIRAIRAHRAVRVVKAVSVVRAVTVVRAVRTVRVVRVVALYKESGEEDSPHSCLSATEETSQVRAVLKLFYLFGKKICFN